jgi:type I restriction enzyme, S subunit
MSCVRRLEDLVVDAPDVHRLRRLVLGMALGGLLNDSTAKLAEFNRPSTLNADDITAEVAQALQVNSLTSRFERLATLAELKRGLTPIQRALPGPYPLVVTGEARMSCDHYDFEGDAVLIPMISSSGHGKASLKRLHYQKGRFALGNILCAAFPRNKNIVSARFLYEYLTAFKDDLIVPRMVGTANVSLTLDKIGSIPVPIISPFASSQLDQLMAMCDQLEQAQKEREARRDALRAATLNRLMVPEGETKRGSADVQFFLDASPRLITKPEHVAALRQLVLDMAIRGRLQPQDPTDQSAAELLERIAIRRNDLLARKFPNQAEARTQQTKQSEQVAPSGEPLPAGWKWATLMQCAALVVDCRNKTVPYTSSGIRLIRTTNVRSGRLVLEDHRYVSEETYLNWSSRYRPEPGDIVITREAPMGEVARIPPGMKVCLGQRLMLVRLIEETIDPDFLVYSLRDSALMDRVQDKPIGALVEHLRVGGVETLLVPVPPVAEQHRIVARVDQLMALCDQLEAALASAQGGRARLLEALLHEALQGGAVRDSVGTATVV